MPTVMMAFCSKHKNESVAVNSLKVCHGANPTPNLLEPLRVDDDVDTGHTFIEFIGDVSRSIS